MWGQGVRKTKSEPTIDWVPEEPAFTFRPLFDFARAPRFEPPTILTQLVWGTIRSHS